MANLGQVIKEMALHYRNNNGTRPLAVMMQVDDSLPEQAVVVIGRRGELLPILKYVQELIRRAMPEDFSDITDIPPSESGPPSGSPLH